MAQIRIALFVLTLLLLAAVMPVVWRRRRRHPVAAGSLLVLMGSVLVWSAGDALAYDVAVSGVPLALDAGVIYLAIGTVVASFAVLATAMAGTGWHPSRRALMLLAIDPVVAGLLAATNPWHGLFIVGAGSRVPETYVNWSPGPLMWVHLAWVYAVVAVSLAVLVFGTWQRPAVLRRPNFLLALAPAPPLLLNLLMLLGYTDELAALGLDRSSLGLLTSSLIVAYAVLRSDLVVVPAVARTLMVEQLADGLIVLNDEGRILDLNPAGRRAVRALHRADGLDVGDRLTVSTCQTADEPVRVELDGRVHRIELRRHWLSNAHGDQLGIVVQARDVTDAYTARQHLLEQMAEVRALEQRLSYEVDHDALTALPNRRRLDRGLSQAAGSGEPYAVVLADVDRFKSVNDRFGHVTGDVVLRHVAHVLSSVCTGQGLLGRWGGEEFVVLLTGDAADEGAALAESLRQAARQNPAQAETGTIPWSLSIGVAVLPGGVPAVQAVVAADRALYAAKRRGRDRVVLADRVPAPAH